MCRLLACRAQAPVSLHFELVEATHSLVRQSCGDRRGECHSDGWGLGWYEGMSPRVVRSVTAAEQDPLLRETAWKASTTVLAHVRAASVGAPTEKNNHPFYSGPWMFAHNGTVTAFDQVGPPIERECGARLKERQGATDSELVFLWLLARLDALGLPPPQWTSDIMAEVSRLLADAVRQLDAWCVAAKAEEPAKLNFVLTDGRALFATRFRHTLYLQPSQGQGTAEPKRVLVASEPIDDDAWTELPESSVLSVTPGLDTAVQSFG